MFKMAFWVALIGGVVFVAAQVLPVYNNNMKINNVIESVALNLAAEPVSAIQARLPQLFRTQGLDVKALPDELLKNLSIDKQENKLRITSQYHVVVWLLGKPISVNPDEDYQEKNVEPMDKIRLLAKLGFDFDILQQTP